MKKSNIDNWICETEHWSCITRKKLEDLQLFRFNHLLSRLKERQGHYKELPDHLNSLSELKTLPFTTPEMLSRHPGTFLLTSQSEVSRVISGSTSGTTGPSKRVFYTEQDTAHTVTFFAAGIGEMVKPGDRVMIAFPFSGPFGLGDLIEQAVLRLDAVPVRAGGCKTYQELCERIAETRPDCYIGFPVPLLSAARFWHSCLRFPDDSDMASTPSDNRPRYHTRHITAYDQVLSAFPIRRALVSGDACPAGVMHALERLLGSPLFPHYGSRETGLSGAITCPAHEGMHLKENHIIAEILDENLHPVPDGTWGELVITTIGLEAMPLIRYRTGDRARFLAAPCPCGSVTRRLDMVSRMENPSLSMEALDNLLFSLPEVIDYQAARTGDCLTIKLYSATGTCRTSVRDLLSQKVPPSNPTGLLRSVHIEEKKCLPGDTFLYPGKRYIL